MTFIKNYFSVILMILAEIVFGILLLINPEKFTQFLIIVFGIVLLIIGIIYFIKYFIDRKKEIPSSPVVIVVAIIVIIIGIICAVFSAAIMKLFPVMAVLYGIFLIISSIFEIVSYAHARKQGFQPSAFILVSAIISIILGVIIVLHPFGTIAVAWTVTGIFLIVSAVLDIISLAITASKASKAK